MDLRHLRYFLAVAEELHFTRAAKRLFIGQPPLSQQIRQLEDEVGTQLFVRGTRSVKLTEAGHAFMPHAYSSLNSAKQAVAAARRAALGELGQLRIGFTSSASFNPFVPAIISSFREAYPDMELVLVEQATAFLIDELEMDTLDVAFLRPSESQRQLMKTHEFLKEPLCVAIPTRHRLSSRRSLRLEELSLDPFVLYPRKNGSFLYDSIIAACQSAGFSPRIVQEAPQMGSTVNLVAAGVGVSIVPESMRHLHPEGVVYVQIEKPVITTSLWVAHLDRGQLSARISNFISHVKSHSPMCSGAPTETNED